MPLSVLLLSAALAAGSALLSKSLRGGDDPAVAAQGPRATVPESTTGSTGERLAMRQLLVRDRTRQRDFERAAQELRSGRPVEAFASLQRLLDRTDDIFLWSETEDRVTSVRGELWKFFESLDSDALATYERLHGPEAERLLAEARRSGAPADYRGVARRFFFTPAGFAATDWLAMHSLDQGRFGQAARLWTDLLETSAHRPRITPALTARAAVAHRLAGDSQKAEALTARLPDARIRIGGRTVAVAEWLSDGLSSAPQRERPAARLLRSSRAASGASVPYLHPVWTSMHSERDGVLVERLVKNWRSEQIASGQPVAVANSPLVVDGKVIVRDFAGIRAFDLRTGATIWRYDDPDSLARTSLSAAQHGGTARFDLQTGYAGNSTLGNLATDGWRLYAIDSMDLDAPDPHRSRNLFDRHSRVQLPESFRAGNRLIAIDLAAAQSQPSDVQPVWAVGGEDGPQELSGHFFLGPPLPLGDRLFAMTESDRQLNLVCLDPATGKPRWTQPLSFVDLPIDLDIRRFPLACTPSYSDGVLVCPTESELLVGFDPDRGMLLWSCYYGDQAERRALGRWPGGNRSTHGHAEFANLPHVAGGQVFYLPRQSSHLHCIDLASGRPIWKEPRLDGEYIGTVTEDVVLVVGHRTCRGLDRDTGNEHWSLSLGMPSGRGIATRGHYLLPLQEGRVATIDLATGEEVGLTGNISDLVAAPADDEHHLPGNLVAADGVIVSVDALGVAVYPQSAALLEQVREDLRQDPDNPQHHLLAAELEISLGRLASGKARLQSALRAAGATAERRRGEDLLRELLYRELRSGESDEQRVLAQLRQLAHTPRERGRLLIEAAESQLRRGEPEAALASVRRFHQLRLTELLPAAGEPGWLISPESWIASAMRRIQEQLSDPARGRFLSQVDLDQQAALQSGTIAEMEAFLRLYPDAPQGAAVRLRLAEELAARGDSQRAELLLIRSRRSDDPVIAGSATRALAELWDQHGLHVEAARLLSEVEDRYANVPVQGAVVGRRYVEEWDDAGLTKIALGRSRGPEWDVINAAVSSVLWSRNNPQIAETFNRFRRKYDAPPAIPVSLLDKGTQDASLITVVDQTSGMTRGQFEAPSAQNTSGVTHNTFVGHFFPLGSAAAMHGISLLEVSSGKPLWTETPQRFGNRRDILRAGPAGPTFAAFQARQHLIVVDPASGRTLWQRTDLDPASGLIGDPYAGLFGDDEVLVVLAGDRLSYTAFRTATGEELRRGKLDLDARQQRRVFGRKLFHIHNSALGPRMRIWDPLTDRMVFDEPAGRRPLAIVTPDDELVVALPPRTGGTSARLQVIDVRSGELKANVPIAASDLENLNYVRAFRAGDRYYINLQRAIREPRARRTSSYLNDSFVDAVHVQGDLLAVDAREGRLLWRRDLPQRSILQFPHVQLPFLVAVSRIGDRWRGNHLSLQVEIIDANTGRTLASEDDLFLDNRILHARYDHEQGRIELHGTKSVVDVNFGRRLQRVPLEEQPL